MLASISIAEWPSSVWPAIGLLAVFLAVVALLRSNKCPRAPGPLLARYSNLWLAKAMASGTFEETNIELHRKHGKMAIGEPPIQVDG